MKLFCFASKEFDISQVYVKTKHNFEKIVLFYNASKRFQDWFDNL